MSSCAFDMRSLRWGNREEEEIWLRVTLSKMTMEDFLISHLLTEETNYISTLDNIQMALKSCRFFEISRMD
eukprot:c46267_g1_i1 orf=330-542(-)